MVNVEYEYTPQCPPNTPLKLSALREAAYNVQVEPVANEDLTAVFEPIAFLEPGKAVSVNHLVTGRTVLARDWLYRVFLNAPESRNAAGIVSSVDTAIRVRYSNADRTDHYLTGAVLEGKVATSVVRVVSMTRRALLESKPPSLWEKLKQQFR
jgi:hypothetical protein